MKFHSIFIKIKHEKKKVFAVKFVIKIYEGRFELIPFIYLYYQMLFSQLLSTYVKNRTLQN